MFEAPGTAYVYVIYGFHHCVNFVCQPKGIGEAVLIRAIEPDFGAAQLSRNRVGRSALQWTSGPGKLCAAMGITKADDRKDLCSLSSDLAAGLNPDWAEIQRERGPIVKTERVGISQAVDLPLRFYLQNSRYVSKRSS